MSAIRSFVTGLGRVLSSPGLILGLLLFSLLVAAPLAHSMRVALEESIGPSLVDEKLTAHLGDYSLVLSRGASADEFTTDAGGLFPAGSFVLQGQMVSGVLGTAAGQEFLFER